MTDTDDTRAAYKLTDQDRMTYKGFQWPEPGEWVETDGGGDLCGPGWLHAYDDPLVALLHNPLHAAIYNPLLWRAEAGGQRRDDHGLKCGYTRMRLIETMPVPEITTRHRVRYAILCTRVALARGVTPAWDTWADLYMAGDPRAVMAAGAASALGSMGDVAWTAARAALRMSALADPREAARAAEAVATAADIDFSAMARQACEKEGMI